MFEIVGTYRGRSEVIDTCDTMTEAEYLVSEYGLAFGGDWNLLIVEREGVSDG